MVHGLLNDLTGKIYEITVILFVRNDEIFEIHVVKLDKLSFQYCSRFNLQVKNWLDYDQLKEINYIFFFVHRPAKISFQTSISQRQRL